MEGYPNPIYCTQQKIVLALPMLNLQTRKITIFQTTSAEISPVFIWKMRINVNRQVSISKSIRTCKRRTVTLFSAFVFHLLTRGRTVLGKEDFRKQLILLSPHLQAIWGSRDKKSSIQGRETALWQCFFAANITIVVLSEQCVQTK